MSHVLSIWLFIAGALVITSVAVSPCVLVIAKVTQQDRPVVTWAGVALVVLVMVPLLTIGLAAVVFGWLAPALGIPT